MADTDIQPLPYDALVYSMVDLFMSSQDTTRPVTADDVLEGSVLLSIFEGVAHPLEYLMYEVAVDLPARFFLNSATGAALDRLVSNFTFGRVVRVAASTGAGTITITGTEVNIPQGFRFRAPNGVIVETLFPAQIAVGETSVDVAAQAITTGVASNLQPGVPLVQTSALPGITDATVTDQWSGGADPQSDEALRTEVVTFLDSLARGVRPAIEYAARQNGYDRVVVIEPGTGRLVVYVDDGNPVSPTKLTTTRIDIHRNWKAAGARLTLSGYVPFLVNITAKAFGDGTVTQSALEAAIASQWATLLGTKRMGDGLARTELIAAAATVAGSNGVNLDAPLVNLSVAVATDEYWTTWSDAPLRPYHKPVLGTITWEH